MSSIKDFYEAEIHENAANNPNPMPNGTQVGAAADPDFASYFRWMDEQIESLVKAVGHSEKYEVRGAAVKTPPPASNRSKER